MGWGLTNFSLSVEVSEEDRPALAVCFKELAPFTYGRVLSELHCLFFDDSGFLSLDPDFARLFCRSSSLREK